MLTNLVLSLFIRSSAQTNLLCGGKDWKVVLKEWLILLSLMKNAQSYFKGSTVKEILVNRFVIFFVLKDICFLYLCLFRASMYVHFYLVPEASQNEPP